MIIINFIGKGKKLEGDQSPASAPYIINHQVRIES